MADIIATPVPSGFQFATNDDNDIFIGRTGSFAGVFRADAVATVCKHCAQTIYGEMVLDQQEGMPFFQSIWNGSPNPKQFEQRFRERILRVAHVTGIVSLETYFQGETFFYDATIQTDYGETSINGGL